MNDLLPWVYLFAGGIGLAVTVWVWRRLFP